MELESIDFNDGGIETNVSVKSADTLEDQIGTWLWGRVHLSRATIDAFVKQSFSKRNLVAEDVDSLCQVTLSNEILKKCVKQFLSRLLMVKKCENCGGRSPTLRKESHSKIFEARMNQRDVDAMNVKGLRRQDPIFHGKGSSPAPETSATTESKSTTSTPSSSIFITPMQVKQHFRLLWEKEQPVLDLMFGTVKRVRVDVKKSRCTPIAKRIRKIRVSSHEQFFLEVIAVPPSKFRPISRAGDKLYDHAQNGYLNEMIKFNAMIVDGSKLLKTADTVSFVMILVQFKLLLCHFEHSRWLVLFWFYCSCRLPLQLCWNNSIVGPECF